MTLPYKARQGVPFAPGREEGAVADQTRPGALRPLENASFGAAELRRVLCRRCRSMAFIIDGDMACCGIRARIPEGEISKRETESDGKRRKLGQREKLRKLNDQGWRCLYCIHRFGTLVRVSDLCYRTLEPVFDHKVPLSYSGDNSSQNFAAACQICNGIKGSRLFITVEDAREHILGVWKRKKYEADGEVERDEESL